VKKTKLSNARVDRMFRLLQDDCIRV